jgi:hypothetical protein
MRSMKRAYWCTANAAYLVTLLTETGEEQEWRRQRRVPTIRSCPNCFYFAAQIAGTLRQRHHKYSIDTQHCH